MLLNLARVKPIFVMADATESTELAQKFVETARKGESVLAAAISRFDAEHNESLKRTLKGLEKAKKKKNEGPGKPSNSVQRSRHRSLFS